MNKPFGRRILFGLLVVSMLLSAAMWAKPATVRAQDEGYAGDVPADSIEPAGPLGPDSPYAPGEGPALPGETAPDDGLTPDGMPLDALAPETAAPPEVDESMLGVLGADPNANAPEALPNGGGFSYPGVSFNHLSTASNISVDLTYFDSPSLNQRPERPVFANVLLNPLGATTAYHNRPLGVFYSATAKQWSVFNEDSNNMPIGVAFNVFKPAQNSVFFTHTATAGNTSNDLTLIDNAYLNNNPNALVFAIPAFNPGGVGGMYHNHNIGVYYDTTTQKWGIYNEDMVAVAENSKFFVYVSHPSYDMAFKHITTAASTVSNYTILDHPLLNGNPNAVINITHEYPVGGVNQRIDQVLGAWYYSSIGKWTIYLNTSTTMPDGFSFNVLVQSNRKDSFVFKADATNIMPGINDHVAVIDHSFLNYNPNALVYVTHNWNPFGTIARVIDDHPLGVIYLNNHWAVYHTDFEAILPNTYYNIYFTDAKANAYSIEAGDQNTTASTMHLSHAQLNGHTDAIYLATQNFNPGEAISGFTYGNMTYAAYGAGLWNILRVGGPDYTMELAYNVLIPQRNSFTHTVTSGNKPNIAETCINNALTNNQPRALVFAYVNGTPAGGGGYYLNQPIGVFYYETWHQWCVYVENTAFNIPLGTTFNIMVESKYPLYIPLVKKQ